MTTIISSIIGLVISLYKWKKSPYSDNIGDLISECLLSLCISTPIGAFVTALLPMHLTICQTEQKLVNLQDNNSVSGSFFLGSGNIDGRMKYVFYYQENDVYTMEQLDYSKVKIRYAKSTPRVLKFTKCPTDNLINNFAYDFDLNTSAYIIEIPEGSIKTNFNLDAQ